MTTIEQTETATRHNPNLNESPEALPPTSAELIASSMGLGFLLIDSQNNGRTDRLILAIILLAILGKITDTLLGLAEKRAIARWT